MRLTWHRTFVGSLSAKRLAQRGSVTLHAKTYPFEAATDALHDLDAGNVRGRAILVP